MKNKKVIFSVLVLIALAFILPSHLSLAACQADATTICNPIESTNVQQIVTNVIKILLDLLGIVSVLMIVIAGFRMVASAGNNEAVEKAKTQLTWSVAGLAIAALAYSIIAIVSNLLKNV